MSSASTVTISSLTNEEEDALIQARLSNDERPLRRLVRKFHAFSSQTGHGISESTPANASQLEEAKSAFLLELANFQMLIRKTVLSCQAESRQVLQYQQEKERLEQEQISQREQITTLKVTLEEAQTMRRRKMEYDHIAERINILPPRSELDQAIKALEADIASIQDEKEQLKRNVQARREKLELVQREVQLMNRVGRENVPEDVPPEGEGADALDSTQTPRDGSTDNRTPEPSSPAPPRLNPEARPFQPSSSLPSLRESVLRKAHAESTTVSNAPSPITTQEEGEEREDVEMGELSEQEKDKPRRKAKEELEEGEASDESSDLSEPPEI